MNIADFVSNIPHHVAAARRNAKACVACGKRDKLMHVELASCQNPKCVAIMRKVNRWSAEVTKRLPVAV